MFSRLNNLYFLLTHYWNATRIDVLHSPFVFSLYNHCIKRQGKDKNYYLFQNLPVIQRRKLSILHKLFTYFHFKTIFQIGHELSYNGLWTNVFDADVKHFGLYEGQIHLTPEVIHQIDFIFIAETLITTVRAEELTQLMHNDSIVFIDQIHANDATRKKWNELSASNEFTVSIDFFFFGILSKRREQVKEHFNLRLI